jgi:hypothetical protein
MPEPAIFSLPGRAARRRFRNQSPHLGVEQLESRRMLAAPTGVVIVAPSPAEGLPAGGTVLTVNGQNFGTSSNLPTVDFVSHADGSHTAGTGVAVTINNIQLQVTQPALPLGTYDVIVTNSDGSSTVDPPNTTYSVVSVVPPTVTSVTPYGATGQTVTIGGTGFTASSQVNFVNRATSVSTVAAGFQFTSDSEVSATVPDLAQGDYDVTVTNSAGTSTINQATDSFTDVAQAVVPATVFTAASSSIPSTLNVKSTVDFTTSGYLFVETTNGVATVQYSNKTDTSFTGCAVVTTDPFNVGATDSTGALDTTYAAVYQATHQTFQYVLQNETKLASGAQSTITYAMYWSSPNDPASFYYLDSPNADGSGGKFSPISNLTLGAALPTYTIAAPGGSSTILLPYMPINSARFFFGVGSAPQLTVVQNIHGDLGVSTPDPASATDIYDYFELTMDANGVDNSVPGGVRHLPSVNINTSQVDQFGLPITLTGENNNNGVNQNTSVGVTLSTNVARDAIFSDYSTQLGGTPYGELLIPSSDPTQPLRILNPGKKTITQSDGLGYVFDSAIQELFETGSTNLSLSTTVSGHTYNFTSSRGTHSAMGSDSVMHTYNVLILTDTADGITLYVYEPFFSTNAPTSSSLSSVSYVGRPPAMQWLTSSTETAGTMVFGNDGVFTDAAGQGETGTNKTILGNLENQIVAALNRGIANKYNTTAEWQDSSNYYPAGETANLYAKFLHDEQINGTQIFIGGKAYAIAYDDQGGQNPSLELLNQDSVTATFGPWIAPSTPVQNASFLTEVYQSVLSRAVDPAGDAYWTNLMNNGTTRVMVSLGIVDSLESHTDTIEGFYTRLLHRSADSQGLNHFLDLYAAGQTDAQIEASIYGSDEYFQMRGGSATTGFLAALYQDALNRNPDSQGEAYFEAQLSAGQSRTEVANMLLGSLEAEQDLVNGYYLAYLARPADTASLTYWTGRLQQDNDASIVQSGILGSDEYYVRA